MKLIKMQRCQGLQSIHEANWPNVVTSGSCDSLPSPPVRQGDEQRTDTKKRGKGEPWMRAEYIPFEQTTCLVSLLKER